MSEEITPNDLINWKQVSLLLTGNDNSIRKNQVPKKYIKEVDKLKNLVDFWIKYK